MNDLLRCYNCKFFATADSGYSNYTVMETVIHCTKKLNNAMPVEESYSWRSSESPTKDHEIFKVAETCGGYKEASEQIHLDVDGEVSIEDFKADDEVYRFGKEYFEQL